MAELLTEEGYELGIAALKIVDTSGNVVLTLPTSDGTSGQVITTDGSGVLSFSSSVDADADVVIDVITEDVFNIITDTDEDKIVLEYVVASNPYNENLDSLVLTTAAQTNITSLGTLTGLTVDSIVINGNTIGLTSDTNLMNLADNVLTVNGSLAVMSVDISGSVDIDGTLETDNLTIGDAQGSDGQVLTSTGSGVGWEDAAGGGGPTFLTENNSLYVGHDPSSTTSTAEYNTALGVQALGLITTGDYCTAVGFDALGDNQTTPHLTAVGNNAMRHITSGEDAVALGSNCLSHVDCVAGNGSVAIGFHSFHALTTGGDGNVAVGRQAGNTQTTAQQSVFVGKSAGWNSNTSQSVGVGRRALQGVTTGAGNTAVGFETMYETVGIGANNTMVGAYCGRTFGAHSNNFGIGYQAAYAGSPGGAPEESHQGYLGDERIEYINAQVEISCTSDKRDKTDVEPLAVGLSFINQLEPVTYRWDKRVKYIKKYQLALEPDDPDFVDLDDVVHDGTHTEPQLCTGLLAQDVEEIEQSFGFDKEDKTALVTHVSGDGKAYSLNYARFVPMLIKSVQELSTQVESLKEEVKILKG